MGCITVVHIRGTWLLKDINRPLVSVECVKVLLSELSSPKHTWYLYFASFQTFFAIYCLLSLLWPARATTKISLAAPRHTLADFVGWGFLRGVGVKVYCNLSYRKRTRGRITRYTLLPIKTKLRGLSPRADYTDRAAAACRRS